MMKPTIFPSEAHILKKMSATINLIRVQTVQGKSIRLPSPNQEPSQLASLHTTEFPIFLSLWETVPD